MASDLPLKRAIQRILQGEFHEGETIRVDVDPSGKALTFASVVEGEVDAGEDTPEGEAVPA